MYCVLLCCSRLEKSRVPGRLEDLPSRLTMSGYGARHRVYVAVSIKRGPSCGRPCNRSPAIWGLY